MPLGWIPVSSRLSVSAASNTTCLKVRFLECDGSVICLHCVITRLNMPMRGHETCGIGAAGHTAGLSVDGARAQRSSPKDPFEMRAWSRGGCRISWVCVSFELVPFLRLGPMGRQKPRVVWEGVLLILTHMGSIKVTQVPFDPSHIGQKKGILMRTWGHCCGS